MALAGNPIFVIPGVTMVGIFLPAATSKSLTALDTEGYDSGVVTTHLVPESNSCLPTSSETHILNAVVAHVNNALIEYIFSELWQDI
jgi:hypothetical protein